MEVINYNLMALCSCFKTLYNRGDSLDGNVTFDKNPPRRPAFEDGLFFPPGAALKNPVSACLLRFYNLEVLNSAMGRV